MNEQYVSKARIILKALIAKRRLKDICEAYEISYKFCHAVSKGNKTPSWDIINKFRFLIPVDFWFEKGNEEFINKVREAIAS